jgi:probable HAF family extracellular repeat protein
MKTHILLRTMFTVVLLFLFSATIPSSRGAPHAVKSSLAASQVRYRVIDLGADNAIANEITDSGRAVGSKDFGDQRHAAFWPDIHTSPIDLGTLPGAMGSRGASINPQGQIVGFSRSRPVFWASSGSEPFELSGLPEGAGFASEINPAGQIVGQFEDDSGVSPVFWSSSNAPAIYLPHVSEQFPNGAAFSVNSSGNILGDACDADFVECHAAFWTNSTSTPVALASPDEEFIYTDLAFSSGFMFAHALNNAAAMVGFAINGDFSETRAVFWASSSSPAMILNTTEEFPNGTAEGINEKRQIVGTAYNSDFSGFHAFVWASPTSPGIDLNAAIPSDSGWELVIARSINNRGEITGAGFLNGDDTQHAIVLVPVHDNSATNRR